MQPPLFDPAKIARLLPRLNQMGQQITDFALAGNVTAASRLIADSAIHLLELVTPTAEAERISAVVWLYEPETNQFDHRVAAGEPLTATHDNTPHVDGLGWRAIYYRRPLLSYEEPDYTILPAKAALGIQSQLCYPLFVANEMLGLLYIYRYDPVRFSAVEMHGLANLVNQATMALYHTYKLGHLNERLSRKVVELEALWSAARRVHSHPNVEETLNQVLLIGLDMLAAQYGSFELYDKKENLLRMQCVAGYNQPADFEKGLPLDETSVVGWVALHRKAMLINDLRVSPWDKIYHPLIVEREMRSEIAVPLIGAGDGLEGVLNIESPHPNAFTLNDQRLLEALATQAVIALQESRLLDALQEISQQLLTMARSDLFRLVIDRACDLINVSAGAIWLIKDKWLVVQESTAGHSLGDQLALRKSLTSHALRIRQPITIDDVRHRPEFARWKSVLQQGWVSLIVVPLFLPGETEKPLGGINFFSRQLRDFSAWDKKVLMCLADHVAVAIQANEQLLLLQQAQERQAIAETFAAVGDLAANLLHQLNNKVGAIPARIQAIEDKCAAELAESAYLTRNLHTVEHSAREALAIVRQSMDHLRPTPRQSVSVAHCVKQALRRAEPPPAVEILQGGLEMLPPVFASEPQLEMVFFNLFDNAFKAMQGKGQLAVCAHNQAKQVIVAVADSGSGIPPEIEPYLFEFGPAQPHSGRLGFGLWWVKTFIDRFGGTVEFDSRVGQGTIFTITLPISQNTE